MPRIYDSASDPHDFCRVHFPTEDVARRLFANRGDGPDDRGNCFGYDAEHPPYDGSYECETCGTPLNTFDD